MFKPRIRKFKSNIIFLRGGLGNQIYQAAFGESLRLKYGLPIVYDDSYYLRDARHGGYKLNELGVNLNIQRGRLLARLILRFGYSLPNYICYFLRIYVEGRSSFSAEEANFIIGYFHNNKIKRADLNFIRRVDWHIAKVKKSELISTNTVAVHVRRGDYLNHPDTYGVVSADYILNAMDYLSRQLNNPHFVFFTDDVLWVQDNFSEFICNGTASFGCNVENDITDFKDLTFHHGFIISNSTFGLLAAVLSGVDHKLIVAPNPWYNDSTLEKFSPCPLSFRRLPK